MGRHVRKVDGQSIGFNEGKTNSKEETARFKGKLPHQSYLTEAPNPTDRPRSGVWGPILTSALLEISDQPLTMFRVHLADRSD